MRCEYCGKEFDRKNCTGRIPKYCSAECRKNVDKDLKRIQYVGKRQTYCEFCKKELPKYKTKYCSDLCRRKHYDISKGIIFDHKELTKKCPVCGKEFKTWKSQKATCSAKCSNRMHYKDRRLKGKIVDKDITLVEVANKYNNQCQICGLLIDWNDKQEKDGAIICGHMYPSIDHIIPLSLGGLHSWDNVQLAHKICNSWKSNRYIG